MDLVVLAQQITDILVPNLFFKGAAVGEDFRFIQTAAMLKYFF
jgi:hypothetical protein